MSSADRDAPTERPTEKPTERAEDGCERERRGGSHPTQPVERAVPAPVEKR